MLTVIPGPMFGIPAEEDDDPYGVKALEAEGLVIREAGTHQRPSAEVFEFKPAPSSPIYGHFSRRSVDTTSMRSKTWRDSKHSLAMSDQGTQTDEADLDSPKRSSRQVSPPRKESQDVLTSERHESPDRERRDSFSDIDSDVEIHEVSAVPMKAKAVTVPKRIPPALPPRNPGRVNSPSPLHSEPPVVAPSDGFDQIDLNGTSGEQKTDTTEPKQEQPELSRAHSTVDDDKFESVPNSPIKEKPQDEAFKKETEKDKDGWGSI